VLGLALAKGRSTFHQNRVHKLLTYFSITSHDIQDEVFFKQLAGKFDSRYGIFQKGVRTLNTVGYENGHLFPRKIGYLQEE